MTPKVRESIGSIHDVANKPACPHHFIIALRQDYWGNQGHGGYMQLENSEVDCEFGQLTSLSGGQVNRCVDGNQFQRSAGHASVVSFPAWILPYAP
nr:hypothetical protein BaRGS_023201 [Batillaria attramentaria]